MGASSRPKQPWPGLSALFGHDGNHLAPEAPTMTAQPLPALTSGDPSAWDQAWSAVAKAIGV